MRIETCRFAGCVSRCAIVCWALLLAVAPGQSVAAEPDSKPAEKTAAIDKKQSDAALDDVLSKDLDNELLEGAGDAKTRMEKKSPGAGTTDQPVGPGDAEGEDVAEANPADDPLAYISQEMRSVEGLIPQLAKQGAAEQLQQRIVEDLAKLIEQAEQQSAQQQASEKDKKQQKTSKRQSVKQPKNPTAGNPGKDSDKPAKDSSDRLTKPEDARPDPQLVQRLLKNAWGHLPERAREQVSQNPPEQFLPQYELMIERYYKRLAEEQRSK